VLFGCDQVVSGIGAIAVGKRAQRDQEQREDEQFHVQVRPSGPSVGCGGGGRQAKLASLTNVAS
jgi:hypothetical protein